MRDAFGGILNITIVAVFLILVSSILAMTVNYTKAFRMKNYVISTIEQYEGSGCGCVEGGTQGACVDKIKRHAENLGYGAKTISCDGGKNSIDGLFCCQKAPNSEPKRPIYSVSTQVDVDLPLLDKILGGRILQVHGDTRPIIK